MSIAYVSLAAIWVVGSRDGQQCGKYYYDLDENKKI